LVQGRDVFDFAEVGRGAFGLDEFHCGWPRAPTARGPSLAVIRTSAWCSFADLGCLDLFRR
jgi:hypothetical protein